jgi:hypothetical protein
LAIEAYSGTNPVWSADGRDLLFQSGTSPSRIYRSRIRPGRTLAADNAVIEPDYALDDSGSGFALLPGDSIFVVRSARPAAVVADVPANIRGKRASVAEQRQLEIAAARLVAELAPKQNRGFANFGIDMRAYVPRGDGPFAGFSDSVKSHVLVSHIESHVSAVGRIFGAAGVVKDENNCIISGPASCRMGQYIGIVAFSPALVSADSARITVIRTERGISANPSTAPYTSVYWRIVFVKSGSAQWTMRSIVGPP